ncbi:MAG: flagellar basal body-associated FliL family protein [Deltaproteobacteria bacterium]|nr:flagellar basal body-associated FliL family protein [Deltaproteobacteria bacterium]MBK8237925.1 flagellar basal body-associated FliL family protein [Deltaproteobacteria bacterium]MBK8718733.1 flagellar basal body-associated FliL family protein [Deltaproteobacteria bacterium]MBP7290949.1 flagellar basal body-associated FliL family protein [Nannocystaceae bacterium]
MSEAAAAAAEPKKGKKPMLLIIIALVVVAGGGGAAFFLMKGGGSAPAHGDGHGAAAGGEHGEKAEGGDHAAPAVGKGPIMELPPIIVNLNEPEGTRYLKANIAISLGDEKVQAEVERLKPVIKDQFIRELSELNFRQTMGAKNKIAVKRRLLKRFNELLGPDAGTEIFLTEFIVQ